MYFLNEWSLKNVREKITEFDIPNNFVLLQV